MTPELKQYLAEIGRKGGSATKGSQKAKDRAKKAAQARWRKKDAKTEI